MRYLTSGYGWSLLLSFTLMFAVMLQASVTAYETVSPAEAQQTLQKIEEERATATAASIFMNNLIASSTLFIPIIGVFPFLFVIYNTGWIIGSMSLAYGIYPFTVVSNLFVVNFTEILAYSILMAENVYMSFLTLTRSGATERLPNSIKSILLYFILLFMASLLEINMIQGAVG